VFDAIENITFGAQVWDRVLNGVLPKYSPK
jgi:hypothetical protein